MATLHRLDSAFTREWASDEGWPYPDQGDGPDVSDPAAEPDMEAVTLHALGAHWRDGLTDLEVAVVSARFGLDGAPERSMKTLHDDLGIDRATLRDALGAGLAKLRLRLA